MGFFYKTYLLRSKSQHSETDRWTLEVAVIPKNAQDGEAKEKTFSLEKTFATKEMADMEGIIYARKIIDGEIEGVSIGEPS